MEFFIESSYYYSLIIIFLNLSFSIINSWLISPEEIIVLKAHSPTIYGLYITIKSLHATNEEAKQTLIELLYELLNKRNKIFSKSNENHTELITVDEYENIIKNLGNNIIAPSFDILELWKTGCYFPGYRVKRKILDIIIPGERFECTKIYKQPRTMGPGILYFFCVIHQKCIGFIILKKPESTRIVTQTIMTRFNIMPKIILYDNGCNLNEFILNRYPGIFEDTRIMVDGFHYQSHSNCSNSYDTRSHPDITNELNTSLLEQKNARYSKQRWTSPFLKLKTFMSKVVFSTMYHNTK